MTATALSLHKEIGSTSNYQQIRRLIKERSKETGVSSLVFAWRDRSAVGADDIPEAETYPATSVVEFNGEAAIEIDGHYYHFACEITVTVNDEGCHLWRRFVISDRLTSDPSDFDDMIRQADQDALQMQGACDVVDAWFVA